MLRSAILSVCTFLLVCTASCASPTGEDIDKSLEETLRSVSGGWSGQSFGTNPITFQFTLQERSGGGVQGSGTMKEQQAATPVPITVSGTFQRPTLTLTFEGMVYEGRSVLGTLRSNYTTVAGVSDSLHLSAQNYSKKLPVLLQEAQ